MEEKKQRRSFGSWLKNVYVPHYLLPTIIVIAVGLFAFYMIRDFFVVKDSDFTLVIGSVDILREEDIVEIRELIEAEVGDANGDGEVVVTINIFTPTVDSDENAPLEGDIETGSVQLQALDAAMLAEPDKVLFLFDEKLVHRFPPDYFENLSEYGFITGEDEPFLRVNNYSVFERLLVVDTNYYFALKGWLVSEKDNQRYIDRYSLAVDVINRLINEP